MMARESRKLGIRFNPIMPGLVATQFARGRWDPETTRGSLAVQRNRGVFPVLLGALISDR